MTLTELLQAVQVDDVLGGSVVSWADEQVGLLQDEVGLLPLLRVQHGSVPQQAHPLKLTAQQAVDAQGGRRLEVETIMMIKMTKFTMFLIRATSIQKINLILATERQRYF